MEHPVCTTTKPDAIEEQIERLRGSDFRRLAFGSPLEEKFEQDTAKERSHRLWAEGLVAIGVLNVCLIVDCLVVKDAMWSSVVKRTAIVTPLSLLVNALMRRNPKRWIREGSVAVAVTLISFINLYAQGNSTGTTTSFGLMAVLITALFTNVVMRLRFGYALPSTIAMLLAALWFVYDAPGLSGSGGVIGASMVTLGVVVTLTAGYSLERQERLSYLLFLRSELQGAELRWMSNIDKLTNLPNRRAFEEQFERLWTEGLQAKTPLSAIVIDIDHFKKVNDLYGHLYGDDVLRRVANLLPQALRVQEDMVARFGGEEFVILLPNAQWENAVMVADRVRKMVEMAGMPASEHLAVKPTMVATVSCGVSTYVPDGRVSRERLLKTADKALYKAKDGGRNRVEFRPCEPVSGMHGGDSGRISTRRLLARRRADRGSGTQSAAGMG
jgi:diguanylate cyclase (GGDEF)-like protein